MRIDVALIVGLLTAGGLAGCLGSSPAEPERHAWAGLVDEEGFAPRLVEDFTFRSFSYDVDATLRIHGEVFLPDTTTALSGRLLPETYPTVMVLSPYLGEGLQGNVPTYGLFEYLIRNLTVRGYAAAFVGSASTGGTGGCWDFMGPTDQRVAVAAVEAVTEQPWSDGKVGMIGVSYDGMTQVMAASRVAPGLVTVVPIAPLTHAYAGLYQGGIHYGGGWMATSTAYHQISAQPPGTNTERYPGWAQSMAANPACLPGNTVLGNDPTGSYNAYYRERDFRPMAKDVEASVFFMQGFVDANVKPDNAFPWFTDIQAPKKIWLGHWAHSTANATNAGRGDMYPTVHRWFDHFLKDIPNGISEELGVQVQDSLGRWRDEAQWPPLDAKELRFYPAGSGALDVEAPASGWASFGGASSLLPGGASAVFASEPMDRDVHVAGIPALEVSVASDRTGGQIIALLDLVRNDGERRLVAKGALNLQLANGLYSPQPLTPMSPVEARVEFYPTDFILEEGARLVLTLQTIDPSLWYNPDLHAATLTVAFGEESAMILPVVDRNPEAALFTGCGWLLDDWVPGCYDEDLRDTR